MNGISNKKIKRAIHIDFHTMPGVEDFGANFSARELVRQLADAHVDYVNVFARCNIGFSYYPTKIGTVYPGMKGDFLGDVIKECRLHGIGVSAYLNGGLNHELMNKQPGFMKIGKDGQVYNGDKVLNNFFRTPCFNTGYRQYLLDEIREILEKDPDGIFCDCMIPRSCYCPSCMNKMRELGMDISDERQVFAFALDTLRDVFREIRQIVPPQKRLFLNSYPYADIHTYQSHVELECLPADGGEWGYDYLATQAPYHRMFSDDLVYMTGRFVGGWGDFGGNKSEAALENDIYDALLYGYSPSVGDHMHPRDGLNKKLYDHIGKVYRYVERLEQWTNGTKPVTEVAVLRNKISYENVLHPITNSDKGVARMLSELKICFDVVDEDMDFTPYKLLILPDQIQISKKLYEKLESFEGSVLSSGESIIKAPFWDYVTEFESDDNTDGFYAYDGEIYGQYCCGVKMQSAFSISEYIEPYFQKTFDGNHGYFYVPPKAGEGYCAIARKENRIHIGFRIFKAYLEYGTIFHKKLIEDMIRLLMPERIIEAKELPSYTRVSLMSSELYDILHIKSTFPEIRGQRGIIEEHVKIPAGIKVSVLGEYAKACVLPAQEQISCAVSSGRTQLVLPEINGYVPILLYKREE